MDNIKNKIERLHNLHSSDLAFYVLGLHSFIEYYIKHKTGIDKKVFNINLFNYNKYLKDNQNEGFHPTFIKQLEKDHKNTNKVRHQFGEIYSNEAESATNRFIGFLKKTDIDSSNYESLKDLYKNWDMRTNNSKDDSKALQESLNIARAKIGSLENDLTEYKQLKKELDSLNSENTFLSSQIETNKDSWQKLKDEKEALEAKIDGYKEHIDGVEAMETYIHYLSRFSLYTRTRAEYEKNVLRLSPDQCNAIDRISLKKDFLIKGAAGTGKSLVLIKAVEKVMNQYSLSSDLINGKVLLLSFSKTLKKYNQYMADLLKAGLEEESIKTVDSFIWSKFTSLFPNFNLDVNVEVTISDTECTRLSKFDIKEEIENFILPGFVQKDEYCQKGGIVRSGMKIKNLHQEEREIIWQVFEDYKLKLEKNKIVNIPYLRYKVLQYLINNPENKDIRDVSYMFVDEVQDMTPCSLAILKELTDGPVIMAGDNNQKIFAATSPYKRANIKIQGSTVILRENFRNTNQIINFVNRFIKDESVSQFESFRDGPEPEVHKCKSRSKALIEKLKIYHEDLGYELHNIAVIVPSLKSGGKSLITKIESAGYKTSFVNDDFDFNSERSIRVTTLQNCKGLDFPVVMLYLPFVYKSTNYDDEVAHEMEKNLLYVACTRAMDNLDIFIDEKPKGILKKII